jgi:hypothetical protein
MSTETKIQPSTLSTAPFDAINNVCVLRSFVNLIAQGTDYYQRIGRRIRITGIHANFQLIGGQANNAFDERNNVVRLAIVEAAPGAAAAGFALFTVGVTSDCRVIPAKRILYDRRFSLMSPGPDSVGYMPAGEEIAFRLRVNIPISYVNTIASSGDTELYLLAVSDSAVSPHPYIANGTLSLIFSDL